MKTSHKILIGVGITAATGATVAFLGSKALIEKVENHHKRSTIKRFIKDKLHGNQKALDLVDQLSDRDVTNLLQSASKLMDLKDKLGEQTDNMPELVNNLRGTLVAYATKIKDHL